MSENTEASKKETAFALAALMEIPYQYRATQSLVNREPVGGSCRRPLPPPQEVIDQDNAVKSILHVTNFKTVEPTASVEPTAAVEPACPICLTNPKDMAFGCGHTTCKDCSVNISSCPICREPIKTRIRLYT